MKPWLILGVLIVALATMGSSCINDSFIIPVNIPLEDEYPTNPGGAWNDSKTFLIIDEIPSSLGSDVVGSRVVDIEVWVVNPPPTAVVSNGVASVNGIPAVNFSGTGADFANPVSLLNPGTPPVITKNQAGIDELVRVLDQFLLDPDNTQITLSSSGQVSPPVDGQLVRVKITVQADLQN